MLRNQHESFSGPHGTAELNGCSDIWLLRWSAARGPLEYTTAAAARRAAEDWTQSGIDPRAALTLPVTPAGSWR